MPAEPPALALAAIYDGASRTEAARIGGVTLQIVRDWVIRFNARVLLACWMANRQVNLEALRCATSGDRGMIESGQIPANHVLVRWLLIDLAQWIYEEFPITVATTDFREPGASRDRLPQALGTTPPSCASRGSRRGF